MNLSFDHDHVGYMGPKAGSSLQAGRPTVPQAASVQTTSQSRLANPHRNPVSYDATGIYNGVNYPQLAPNILHYRHASMYGGQEQYIKIEEESHANQGNSLNLSGLLREPTPEPPEEIVLKKEEVEVKAEPIDYSNDGDIDIGIRNVVCNYTLPLHIDLRRYALASANVTYDRGRGVLLKQNRNPNCYVKIYSSGKVYIVGCKSEDECMRAARTVARGVQRAMGKLNDVVKIRNYKVCNVLATCKMPFGVKIEELAQKYPAESQYEPELSVGLVWRSTSPKGTLRIHTTGSITITGAQSEAAVMELIEIIYPIVREFRCSERHRSEKKPKKRKARGPSGPAAKKSMKSGAVGNKMYFSDEDELYDDSDLDDLDD